LFKSEQLFDHGCKLFIKKWTLKAEILAIPNNIQFLDYFVAEWLGEHKGISVLKLKMNKFST